MNVYIELARQQAARECAEIVEESLHRREYDFVPESNEFRLTCEGLTEARDAILRKFGIEGK